ncbi:hypothetical protein BCF33_1134 [Hasllibacter halocynthiae]|uniref:Uncharacterized protein n=1 Tax=Hasllibacter halocynthiae TaxID=595589 RepID=A0A2T0X9B7_9RHOB|nr:hypothetical protein [Hasllibacter halocynthiae]PRY95513.1 hypothetical protein BCF33_1134 [Hasllibacter halocynthiae]
MRALALILLATSAGAEGLDGLRLTMWIELRGEGGAILASADPRAAVVGDGPEFGFDAADDDGGYRAVPAVVDVAGDRLTIGYGPDRAIEGGDRLGTFNGYVLTFAGAGCTTFEGGALVAEETSIPMPPERVRIEADRIEIDVDGIPRGPGDRITVALSLGDCLLG